MKTKLITSIFITVLLALVALVFFFNKKEDNKTVISLRQERVIKPLLHKPNFEMRFNFTPNFLKANDTTLSLLNYNTQKVLLIDQNARVYDSLGGGRGEGPMETDRMYNYEFDQDDFYFFDVSNASIVKSSRQANEPTIYYRDSLRIEHAQRIADSDFIILYKDINRHIAFSKININTKSNHLLQSVNLSFPKKRDSWWLFDGVFDKDQKNNIIYMTYFSDNLLKIDPDGSLIYNVDLIHDTPLIELTYQGEMIFPSANTYQSALDTAIDLNYIYVLSNVSNKGDKGKRVIDAYITGRGSYSHSYILPNMAQDNKPLEIEVMQNTFIVLYEDSIQKFSFD